MSCKRGRKSSQDSQAIWFVIARYSPYHLLQVGLVIAAAEKSLVNEAHRAEQSISPVRFVYEESRNPGIDRAFQAGRDRFSLAVQTAWPRGVDSAPRYSSEWRKSRRLRKLRGINQFRNSPETACSPLDTLISAVSRSSRGQALVIVWLKVVTSEPQSA